MTNNGLNQKSARIAHRWAPVLLHVLFFRWQHLRRLPARRVRHRGVGAAVLLSLLLLLLLLLQLMLLLLLLLLLLLT